MAGLRMIRDHPADMLVRGPCLGDLTLQFWCDGCYDDRRKRFGFGIVVQEHDEYVMHHSHGGNGRVTAHEVELAAVAAAMEMVRTLAEEETRRAVVLTDNTDVILRWYTLDMNARHAPAPLRYSPPGTRPRAHWMAHHLSRWRTGIAGSVHVSQFFPELDKCQKRA